jgi:hypothetical protein
MKGNSNLAQSESDGRKCAFRCRQTSKTLHHAYRRQFGKNMHPPSASYADASYFGIHAFTLTNAAGEKKLVKLKLIPSDGEKGLNDDEAKAKGADYYEAYGTPRQGTRQVRVRRDPRQGGRPDQRSHPAMGRRGREADRGARHDRDRRDRGQ